MIADYERYVLSACFIDSGAIKQVAPELPETSFGYGQGDTLSSTHRLIFRAMVNLYQETKPIDTATVAAQLGAVDLKLVGNQQYLTQLAQSLASAGIYSTEGLPQWARVVDNAGRARLLQQVLNDHSTKLTEDVKDVDAFYADLLTNLQAANTIKTSYSHIGLAVEESRERLSRDSEGMAASWLPMPWVAAQQFKLFPRDSLVVLQGLSSVGKSQLAAEFALGTAIQLKRYNIPGVNIVNTYEMRGWRYIQRMAACLAQVNLRLPLEGDNLNRVNDAHDFLATLPIYIDDKDMTSTQIISHALNLQVQYGAVHLSVLDYSELVPDKNQHEELRIANVFKNGKKLGRLLDSCSIVISQLSYQMVAASPALIGGLGATRYSRVGGHAPDVVLELWNGERMKKQKRTFKTPEEFVDGTDAYVIILKNREGNLGHFGLDWTPGFTRFSDPTTKNGELFEGLGKVWREQEGDW